MVGGAWVCLRGGFVGMYVDGGREVVVSDEGLGGGG